MVERQGDPIIQMVVTWKGVVHSDFSIPMLEAGPLVECNGADLEIKVKDMYISLQISMLILWFVKIVVKIVLTSKNISRPHKHSQHMQLRQATGHK